MESTVTGEKLKNLLERLQQWTLPTITEKQRMFELAKSKIKKLTINEARDILKLLLEKHPDIVLPLLK